MTNVVLHRRDDAALITWHVEYEFLVDGTVIRHPYVDCWPRRILMDDVFLNSPMTERIDDETIRLSAENGSAVYRFVQRENEIITLWEGIE